MRAQTGTPAPALDESVHTILVRWGMKDKAEKGWKGSIEAVAQGQVLGIQGYHFQGDDAVDGANAWHFQTRRWIASFLQVDLTPALPGPLPIFPNGVFATVRGTRFRLVSNGESYALSLAELAHGKAASFAGGNVQAELVPVESALSERSDSDFPALASGPGGSLAAAWLQFSKEDVRDRVVCRVFDGKAWRAPEEFALAETRDVFRPALAYDGGGTLHVIWAAQVDGNWDLYERRRTTQGWQAVERLTRDPGSDFHQRVVADANGDLWLAWQGFRNGQSDIYLKRFTGGQWGAGDADQRVAVK